MRTSSLLVAVLVTGTAVGQEALIIRATPVALRPLAAEPVHALGALHYEAGFELESDDARFGGISGMLLLDGGTTLLAVSDNGRLFRIPLLRDTAGLLTGVGPSTSFPILGAGAVPLALGEGDSEEIQLLPDGRLLVAFEHHHRLATIGSIKDGLERALEVPFPTPQNIALAPKNGGMEAVLTRADGSVLAIREKPSDHLGKHAAWIIREKPASISSFTYRTADGFQPTALIEVGADVITLERRYRMLDGIAGRLVRFPASQLAGGGEVVTSEIARFEPGMICDNFEAMASLPGPKGTTILIASDNNFNPGQHTYLLELTLPH